MCKPQKGNGMKGKEEYQTRQEKVARISEEEQINELEDGRTSQLEMAPGSNPDEA